MLDNKTEYKVKGYTNKWSIIDTKSGFGLLENCTYGDETCCLVVRMSVKPQMREYTKKSTGEKVMLPTIESKVYETYDNLETALSDYNLRQGIRKGCPEGRKK